MGETITLTGMVLSAMSVGEYDKRLVILTKERGKVSAFARGARRMNSPFMAGSRPFSFGGFELYEGRSSYTVSSMSIANYFAELANDVVGALYGFYFLELAEYYTRENVDESQMLKLLYQSLRALMNENLPDDLVRVVYELKAMAVNGEYPQVYSCMSCGGTQGAWLFHVEKGGTLCRKCSSGRRGLPMSEAAVYTMQYIASSTIEKLYTFKVSEQVLGELKEVAERLAERNMDRKMKSLDILKSLDIQRSM